MDLQTLTEFFKWFTIVTAGVYIYTVVFAIFTPDFIFNMQKKWFKMSRQTFNIALYGYIGLFKIVFIVFVLAPYIALEIIS